MQQHKPDTNIRLGNGAQSLSNGLLGIGIVGLLGSSIFAKTAGFYFSYLTAFMFFLTITLGALFFLVIQHLVRSGWSVVVRRIAENMAMNVWLFPILFIPILLGMPHLYYWTHIHEVVSDHILQGKSGYLNIPFFLARAAVYFGVWIFLARRFFNNSIKQDESGDEKLTLNSQRTSTYGVLLFALSITFASIDWVMSLTPHWYSTMWGVYTFAGSMVSFFAFLGLAAIALRRLGYLGNTITLEHYHDTGKLLYGFNVFWAYIAFSQYFLIWYANIPEETIWFNQHFVGTWNLVGILLAVGHFAIPFLIFMSRHAKRNLKFHAFVAVWMLCIHYVDVFWVIMPNVRLTGFSFHIVDTLCLIGIGGIYLGMLIKRMAKHALYPIRDPRLQDSLHHLNH